MTPPRLLDLFCCEGGAGMGYNRAGFDVTGVDNKPQPRYPFEFVQADALEFLAAHGHEFDAIHASPPCQGYLNLAKLNASLGRVVTHERLIGATRDLLIAAGKPYVIENVSDARPEMIGPVQLCGTAFWLPLRRHRLFESSMWTLQGTACRHSRFREPKFWTSHRPKGVTKRSTTVQVYGNGGEHEAWPAAMGIDWMDDQGLREAIPPAYTQFIGEQLLSHLAESAA